MKAFLSRFVAVALVFLALVISLVAFPATALIFLLTGKDLSGKLTGFTLK